MGLTDLSAMDCPLDPSWIDEPSSPGERAIRRKAVILIELGWPVVSPPSSPSGRTGSPSSSRRAYRVEPPTIKGKLSFNKKFAPDGTPVSQGMVISKSINMSHITNFLRGPSPYNWKDNPTKKEVRNWAQHEYLVDNGATFSLNDDPMWSVVAQGRTSPHQTTFFNVTGKGAEIQHQRLVTQWGRERPPKIPSPKPTSRSKKGSAKKTATNGMRDEEDQKIVDDILSSLRENEQTRSDTVPVDSTVEGASEGNDDSGDFRIPGSPGSSLDGERGSIPEEPIVIESDEDIPSSPPAPTAVHKAVRFAGSSSVPAPVAAQATANRLRKDFWSTVIASPTAQLPGPQPSANRADIQPSEPSTNQPPHIPRANTNTLQQLERRGPPLMSWKVTPGIRIIQPVIRNVTGMRRIPGSETSEE